MIVLYYNSLRELPFTTMDTISDTLSSLVAILPGSLLKRHRYSDGVRILLVDFTVITSCWGARSSSALYSCAFCSTCPTSLVGRRFSLQSRLGAQKLVETDFPLCQSIVFVSIETPVRRFPFHGHSHLFDKICASLFVFPVLAIDSFSAVCSMEYIYSFNSRALRWHSVSSRVQLNIYTC